MSAPPGCQPGTGRIRPAYFGPPLQPSGGRLVAGRGRRLGGHGRGPVGRRSGRAAAGCLRAQLGLLHVHGTALLAVGAVTGSRSRGPLGVVYRRGNVVSHHR